MLETWNENNHNFPIIVSIPHSGTYFPNEMKEQLLQNVCFPNMDWYLPKLYFFLKKLGITTIVNHTSRYVIDVNRNIEETQSASYITNYVYEKTTFGDPIYKKKLKKEEIRTRIKKYYNPYHSKLKELIQEKERKFQKVYIFDLHSFGKDLKEDIILGNDCGNTTTSQFLHAIQKNLEKRNFLVGINNPYSGGYITKNYHSNKVFSIQIELNYKKYIDNRSFEKEEFPKMEEELFFQTQKNLKEFFAEVITLCKKDA